MAIGTLSACYNNPRVFTGVVKIRKGQAVEMIMGSTNMGSIKQILAQYTLQVRDNNEHTVCIEVHTYILYICTYIHIMHTYIHTHTHTHTHLVCIVHIE